MASEKLATISEREAIEQSKLLFEQRRGLYHTFEVWYQTRKIYRDPQMKLPKRRA